MTVGPKPHYNVLNIDIPKWLWRAGVSGVTGKMSLNPLVWRHPLVHALTFCEGVKREPFLKKLQKKRYTILFSMGQLVHGLNYIIHNSISNVILESYIFWKSILSTSDANHIDKYLCWLKIWSLSTWNCTYISISTENWPVKYIYKK